MNHAKMDIEFKKLKEEFSRLTHQLDIAMSSNGIKKEDLDQVMLDMENGKLHKDVQAVFLGSQEQAKREGSARSAQFKNSNTKAKPSRPSRQGAMRI